MPSTNLFIALEGIDGSGKSTQVNLLAEKLKAEGHKVYTTCEPTDSTYGKLIRQIFKSEKEASHEVIAALFLADRLEHIGNKENGLLKKLQQGFTVITDRYYFSSYAYHGVHMDMQWVIQANSICAKLLRPDLNLYIDVDPKISMERIRKNRTDTELYETLDNLQKVASKYKEAFTSQNSTEHIISVNGNQPAQEIANTIWDVVSKMLHN